MVTAGVDPETFVREMTDDYRERMEQTVDAYYAEDYFDRLGGPEAVIRTEFPHTAWRELFFGCLPTNRQVHLVYEQGDPYGRDRDLIVGMLKQLRDEVKHARIFSNIAEQFGVDSDLVTWETDYYDRLVNQCRVAVEHDKPHYIAASFQCSTEIAAAFMINNMATYLAPEYPDIAAALRDVSSDEGDHVHVGRLIVTRFASPDDYERMEALAERKYDAVVAVLQAL